MRAAWLVPLWIVACSVDLEPLVAGGDAGSAAKGGSAKDASLDQCSWNCGNGGSGANGGWTGDASGGVGAQAGFSAGGTGAVAGGANGGSSGVGATGGVGGGSGGTGPTFQCYPISQIPVGCDDPNQQACSCLGCNYVYCEDPEDQFPLNDCVCFECWGSPSCPPQACNGDGLCDPYGESCGCPDCKFHPECYGY